MFKLVLKEIKTFYKVYINIFNRKLKIGKTISHLYTFA